MPNPGHRYSTATPEYSFDESLGKYRNNKTGRFESQKSVVGALETQVEKARKAMGSLTNDLRSNKIDLTQWRAGMMQNIKTIHVVQYAAGQGGWANLTQSDFGKMGAIIKEQYAYLNGFVHDLQEQLVKKGEIDGRANVRADLYANASNATYAASQKTERYEAGMTEEQRVLNPGESCDDCIGYAARGWQPIFTLPPIGDSECQVNCNCEFEYR